MKNHKTLNLFGFDVLYHEYEFRFENLNVELFVLLTTHVWLRHKALGGWLASI